MTWEIIKKRQDWDYSFIDNDSPLLNIENLKLYPDKLNYSRINYIQDICHCNGWGCNYCEFINNKIQYFGPNLTYNPTTYNTIIKKSIINTQLIISQLKHILIKY